MLTELEKDVLEIIKEHVGYERAINQYEITYELSCIDINRKYPYEEDYSRIDPRQVRKAIASLIKQGYPIISTPKNGGGYCWMNRGEEGLECAKRIKRQAVKLFLKARQIRENSRVGQLSL